MARYEAFELEAAAGGGAPVSGDMLFRLGLMYSTGASVPPDRIEAHKWFNLAAVRGNREAALCRKELAAEMTETEVAAALKAAREWMRAH